MDWETLERKQVQSGWKIILAGLLLLYAFLPIGAAVGWVSFFKSPLFNFKQTLVTLLVGLPVAIVGVRLLLVAPFVWSGFLIPQQKPYRLGIAFLLWGLPLLSFAYWQGDFRNSLHAYDLCVFLIGALGLPLVAYWRTGNAHVLSVGIALIAFVPLFVMEDILGPFSPLWVYASMGPGIYALRTLSLGGALLAATLSPVPRIGRVKNRVPLMRLGLGLLAVLSIAVMAGDAQTPKYLLGPSIFRPDVNWAVYLGLLFFTRQDPFSRRVFNAMATAQMFSLLVQVAYSLFYPDASLWAQVRLLETELAVGVIAMELVRRKRPTRIKLPEFNVLDEQSSTEPAR